MANILKNFLGYLKLGDDDDYEDYVDDYDEEEERRRLEREERARAREQQKLEKDQAERGKAGKGRARQTEPDRAVEPGREKVRTERTSHNKIVPIRTTPKGLEVCIMKPTSFEDSQDICDMLLSGRAVVVNLEGFDPDDAQRIMDFISGAVYAINGKLHQISRYIFIFSPDNIDISGDYQDLVPVEGFGVPHLNKEF